jgi:hypothetical protein
MLVLSFKSICLGVDLPKVRLSEARTYKHIGCYIIKSYHLHMRVAWGPAAHSKKDGVAGGALDVLLWMKSLLRPNVSTGSPSLGASLGWMSTLAEAAPMLVPSHFLRRPLSGQIKLKKC